MDSTDRQLLSLLRGDARLSFRTCDKRPTQSLPMELRTHAKPINLKCMRCLPLERLLAFA